MKKLAIFDFDGTLIYADSLLEFIKFYYPKSWVFRLMPYLPIFVLYKVKVIDNSKAKEKLFSFLFKDVSFDKFIKKCKMFSKNIDKFLNKDVYNRMKFYQKNGWDVYIISASIECYLKFWCEREGVKLISTKLSFKEGKFTGKFLTKNCYGIEKLNRLKKEIDLSKYSEIDCYADSKSDEYIMSIASRKFWVKNGKILS